MNIAFLLAGGAIGALTRHWVSILSARLFGPGFPIGTLIVNLLGCLLIGLVFGIGENKGINHAFRLFFITGFLGALTTFSTFGLETVRNADNGLINLALVNIAANNIGGIILVKAGLMLAKVI